MRMFNHNSKLFLSFLMTLEMNRELMNIISIIKSYARTAAMPYTSIRYSIALVVEI